MPRPKRQFLQLSCVVALPPPRLRAYADYALEQRLQQGLAADEMGFGGVSLRSSNLEPFMSALGQKQTLADVRAMSALPPKSGH